MHLSESLEHIKCSSKKKSCCLVPRAQIRNIITVLFLMFWIYYDKFNQIYSKSFFLRREIFAFWATT